MKKYKVYHSFSFDEELQKCSKEIVDYVDKFEDQLVENPYSGKPLGFRWFREKRLEGYRFYYLIYDDLKSVFMVGISRKKDQQKVINTIKLLFEYLKEELKDLIDKEEKT